MCPLISQWICAWYLSEIHPLTYPLVYRWEKVSPYMICPQLVKITMENDVFAYWTCHHICLSYWWTWCGTYSPRWYVLNSSISQWKVIILIATVTIYVWFLGGLGVESTPLDDMSSTRQYHNGKWRISLLDCHHMYINQHIHWFINALMVSLSHLLKSILGALRLRRTKENHTKQTKSWAKWAFS